MLSDNAGVTPVCVDSQSVTKIADRIQDYITKYTIIVPL